MLEGGALLLRQNPRANTYAVMLQKKRVLLLVSYVRIAARCRGTGNTKDSSDDLLRMPVEVCRSRHSNALNIELLLTSQVARDPLTMIRP